MLAHHSGVRVFMKLTGLPARGAHDGEPGLVVHAVHGCAKSSKTKRACGRARAGLPASEQTKSKSLETLSSESSLATARILNFLHPATDEDDDACDTYASDVENLVDHGEDVDDGTCFHARCDIAALP